MLSNSPTLIAANHVLHRLLLPRHSPFALSSLTKLTFSYAQTDLRLIAQHTSLLITMQHTDPEGSMHTKWQVVHTYQHSCYSCYSEKYSFIKDRLLLACKEPVFLKGKNRRSGSTSRRSKRPSKSVLPKGRTGFSNKMVELIGFEPTTSGLQSPRSPS